MSAPAPPGLAASQHRSTSGCPAILRLPHPAKTRPKSQQLDTTVGAPKLHFLKPPRCPTTLRSYVDPTLFAIYYHFDISQYGQHVRDLALSLKQQSGADARPLLSALLGGGHVRTFAHEHYHYWQGLRLPFLHRYAVLTFREIMLTARYLARNASPWTEWANEGVVAPAFHRLDIPHHVAIVSDSELVYGVKDVPNAESKIQFTAIDMLECAASLFEYQISCQDPGAITDLTNFERWRKRRAAYLDLFDFATPLLIPSHIALAFMIPLINAAFHTTRPEQAFIQLLAKFPSALADQFAAGSIDQSEGDPRNCRFVVDDLLKTLNYHLPYGKQPDVVNIHDNQFYYLSDDWLSAGFGNESESMSHPILGPISKRWSNRAQRDPGVADWLDYPGYIRSENVYSFVWDAEPTVRVLRLKLDGQYKVLVFGSAEFRSAFSKPPSASDASLRDFLLDVFAVYGAVRQALGLETEDTLRRCFHQSCPFYQAACCNGFPLIPNKHQDCSFPQRMEDFVRAMTASDTER